MAIELNRLTFKRLVWFYIASAFLSVAVLAPQYLLSGWAEFGVEFDQLVLERFGEDEPSDVYLYTVAGLGGIGVVWMVASTAGLFWFKRWARFGSWASLILLFIVYGMILGLRPSYVTIVDDVIALIDGALFGAIMLLAYAKGLGAEWFGKPTAPVEG